MGDHGVDPPLHHLQPRPDRLAPQLCEGDIEVEEIVGVEHDPLGIALAVADAQLVCELLVHRYGAGAVCSTISPISSCRSRFASKTICWRWAPFPARSRSSTPASWPSQPRAAA